MAEGRGGGGIGRYGPEHKDKAATGLMERIKKGDE
jgi:hypothetical protein